MKAIIFNIRGAGNSRDLGNSSGKSRVYSSSRDACNSRDAIKSTVENKSRDARESNLGINHEYRRKLLRRYQRHR
jgi:hypothetical protein